MTHMYGQSLASVFDAANTYAINLEERLTWLKKTVVTVNKHAQTMLMKGSNVKKETEGKK